MGEVMIFKRNHHPAAPPTYAMACEVATAVMAVAAVVSAAVGTYSAVQQGEAAQAQANYAAKQKRDQEEAYRTAALQEEAARREELQANLSTFDAFRAGRGLGSTSPTALTLRDDITGDAMDEMRVRRINMLNGAESARQGAIMAERRGQSELTAGYLGAAGSALNGFRRTYSLLDFGSNPHAGSTNGGWFGGNANGPAWR
jgi:hypothetical protein